jgi:uncharacterized membrane protein YhaH (DUF805 family)
MQPGTANAHIALAFLISWTNRTARVSLRKPFSLALFSLTGWPQILVIKSVRTQTEVLLLILIPAAIYAFSWSSLVVKRLHNMGRSGFWVLGITVAVTLCRYVGFMMFPTYSVTSSLQIISWLILVVLFVILLLYPGEDKDNAYGPASGDRTA